MAAAKESWRAIIAYKPVDSGFLLVRATSETWSGNLSGGQSSVGRHLQGRWNYPDKSLSLMVGLIMLQGMEM